MKEYYLELEKNNREQALEAVRLFKKLGYKPDEKWNDKALRLNGFNCVICFTSGNIAIHRHISNIWGHEEITLQQLRELAS